jgi:anti-anti-sigma regulatory factor
MLMINEQQREGAVVFKLAGALTGVWADELERCWRNATVSASAPRVLVDLTEVTFVDESGKELLRLMREEGAELIARDILMKSIVEEIANESFIA